MAACAQHGNAWWARGRLKGETLTKTFGTKAEAEQWAERAEARILAPPKRTPPEPPRLASILAGMTAIGA